MEAEKSPLYSGDTIQKLVELSNILDKRWMDISGAKVIYDLLCRYTMPPKQIVEVGTFCGTGAIYMATMVEPWGGHVTTIDLPWTGEPNHHFTKTVDDWIAELGITNITVVRREDGAEGWFKDYLEERTDYHYLDFVYIDGGHSWLNTVAQFAMAYAAIRQGGWICFDDLQTPAWPEVDMAWKNVVLKSKLGRYHRISLNRLGFVMRYDHDEQ